MSDERIIHLLKEFIDKDNVACEQISAAIISLSAALLAEQKIVTEFARTVMKEIRSEESPDIRGYFTEGESSSSPGPE